MRSLLLIATLAACSSGAKHDEAPAPPPPAPASAPAPSTAMPKVSLATPQGEVTVSVEIVATPAAIERGLMYREHLPPDQGMLFLMNEERQWTFWMHNTLIPLDILFIKKDLTIAGIVENATPRSDELRQVDGASFYVLELNGGYCAAHKVVAGAKVRFDGVPSTPTH